MLFQILIPTHPIKKPIPALEERITEFEKSNELPPNFLNFSEIILAPETNPHTEQKTISIAYILQMPKILKTLTLTFDKILEKSHKYRTKEENTI